MNIYLALLLLLAIIVFSNLIMFLAVRSSKGIKINWFNGTKDNLKQPFKLENDRLNELRERVEDLNQPDE